MHDYTIHVLLAYLSHASGFSSYITGIPIVQLVAGSRISTSTDEGFALVLSDVGDVYSWGEGYIGRLGHASTENVHLPKMIDALGGKDIKMVLYLLSPHTLSFPPFPSPSFPLSLSPSLRRYLYLPPSFPPTLSLSLSVSLTQLHMIHTHVYLSTSL